MADLTGRRVLAVWTAQSPPPECHELVVFDLDDGSRVAWRIADNCYHPSSLDDPAVDGLECLIGEVVSEVRWGGREIATRKGVACLNVGGCGELVPYDGPVPEREGE